MDKIKIFVSWSGPRSAAVAEALKEYLPMINNAFDPWLSSQDITKGSRSTMEIAQALAAAKAGIICLTPNNLTAPWILFEAGGLAKTVDKPFACTLLIGLEPSDVSKPLGDFQHTRLDEKELLQLVKTLNGAAGEGARKDTEIERVFKLCWPELSEKLEKLPSDGSTERPERPPSEMLEELMEIARSNSSEITAAHIRIAEFIERSVTLTQSQIDHLINILSTTAFPTWGAAAASGMLSAHDGSSAATPQSVYGRVPLSQRGYVLRTVSAEEAARAHAAPLNQIEDDKPQGGPEKK